MIIVTGGAGFIGSNIVAELEQQGYKDIVVVDWLGSDDKWKNIAKRELAAVIQPEQLSEFLENHKSEIEAIIHMGAVSATTEKDVDLIIKSNFQLSWELWCSCRDNDKQFSYASSAATYGDGSSGFIDRDDLEFVNKLRPLNAYGWSKMFDKLMHEKAMAIKNDLLCSFGKNLFYRLKRHERAFTPQAQDYVRMVFRKYGIAEEPEYDYCQYEYTWKKE